MTCALHCACKLKANTAALIASCLSVLVAEIRVDNPPITPSVPLRDSILQGRVSDKEPLSRDLFGHQKRDDVISDRSAVSAFPCRWFPQKTNLLKSHCTSGPVQTPV